MTSPYIAVAKFQVSQVNRVGYRDAEGKPYTAYIEVQAGPVYAPSGDGQNENWKFSQASPSGSFELRIDNPALFDAFFVGQQLYFPMIDADRVSLADVSNAIASLPEKAQTVAAPE